MKTIIFSTYDDIKNPYYAGGGAIAIHEVAKRLSKKYIVKVISWNHIGVSNEYIDGVNYHRIGNNFFGPQVSMALFQILLPFVIQKEEFDILFESFAPPFVSSFLKFFTSKKVYGVVHMLPAQDMLRKYKINIFDFFQRATLKLYDNFIVTSEHIKKTISKLNDSCSINVIGNGINTNKFHADFNKRSILFLGRIEVDQKGIDLLINVFEKISKKLEYKVKLYIAGSGTQSELNKMNYLVSKSQYKNNIVILGRVTGKKKELLLKKSKIVIVPSRFETFSMTTLEAFSFGLPVVAFDIDGLSWAPKSAIVRCTKFDLEKMADSVVEVIINEKKYKSMSISGKNYAKKYDWYTISKKYEEIIKSNS